MDKKKKLILIAVSFCLFAGVAYFGNKSTDGSILKYLVSMYNPKSTSSDAEATSSCLMTFGQ